MRFPDADHPGWAMLGSAEPPYGVLGCWRGPQPGAIGDRHAVADRSMPASALPCPAGPSVPWPRRTVLKVSAARRDGLPSWSVLGPQRTGEPRTTAVRSGHRTIVGTARSLRLDPSDLARRRRALWSSSLPTRLREPSASCLRDGGPRGRAFPSGRAGSRHQQVEPSPLSPGRATHVHGPSDLPRPSGRSTRRRSSRLIGTFAATVVSDASTSPVGAR
jgi:hypothetical protein